MAIKYSPRFSKQYQKANNKIKVTFRKRRELFNQNPFSPQLNNHKLSGRYKGFRSINITGDWRAIFSEQRGVITFVALGTHSQLYK